MEHFCTIAKEIKHLLQLYIAVLVLCFGVPAQAKTSNEDLLTEALTLLNSGNPERAFQLLETQEDAMAGWWEYDYLLGIAALDSGRENLAVFALQRTIAMHPDMLGAHIDLGRAYYEIKEYDDAKKQFNMVLNHNPSHQIKNMMHQYLDSIQSIQRSKNKSLFFNIAGIVGYDSNANSATDQSQFNGFSLPRQNVKTASSYMSANLSVLKKRLLNQQSHLAFAAHIKRRNNENASQVNHTTLTAQAAWSYRWLRFRQNTALSWTKTSISNDLSNDIASLVYRLDYRASKPIAWHAISSVSKFNYNASLATRNIIQGLIGGGVTLDIKPYLPSLTINLIAGKEIPEEKNSVYGRSLAGIRLISYQSLKLSIPAKIGISGGLVDANYADKFFTINRHDQLIDASIQLSLYPWKSWEFALQTIYLKNQSNVSLYDYTRLNTFTRITKTF